MKVIQETADGTVVQYPDGKTALIPKGEAIPTSAETQQTGTQQGADVQAENTDVHTDTPAEANTPTVSDAQNGEQPSVPVDSQGKPLPLRTNSKGEQVVDEKTLWNNSPEEWCIYNDKRDASDKVMTSDEMLESAVKALDKQQKAVEKQMRKAQETMDMDVLDGLKEEQKRLNDRKARLTAIQASRAEAAKKAEQQKREVREAEADAKFAEEKRRRDEARAKKAAELAKYNTESMADIRKKWSDAPKETGYEDEIVLNDGTVIKGHYVLTEANAPTASHDTQAGYAKTKGFPVDANGKSVNDRDYEHDKDAQAQVEQKAQSYDQRALQTPVVVSQDGIVLSGNDRTMASQIAARNGTDGKYVEYLSSHAGKYGFTAEQVGQYSNPRVVFVVDGAAQYDAATFAKFNADEKKSQSKTESAVKAGKTLSQETIEQIADIINRYDTIAEVYADPKAVSEILSILVQAGHIQQNEVSKLRDGDRLSGTGEDVVESILLGAVMQEDALRCAMEDRNIRRVVMSALAQLVSNGRLGDYALTSEFSKAVVLLYQAKRSGLVKQGESVANYMSQPVLAGFGENPVASAAIQMIANVINGAKVKGLKNLLTSYNTRAENAAAGQADLFLGGVENKEDIIREILNEYGYDTETFSNAEQRAAGERTRTDSSGQSAVQDAAEQGGNTEEQTPDAVSSDAGNGAVEQTNSEESETARTDKQGNPLNEDGTLRVEEVKSVDELTDEDFTAPTRNVQLPKIPQNVDDAIGANGKPVVIKKNIFARNSQSHPEVTPQQAREILSSALYRPDLYGQNQKASRPYNWIVINTKDANGQNRLVVLEVNSNKDNIEIVHWYSVRDNSLRQIERQAREEGGQILILPSNNEEAGGLSSRQTDLSSADKVTESSGNSNTSGEKVEENAAPKNEGQFGLVSDARMEELKKRLKAKLTGQLNSGFDPEVLAIGMEMAAGYIDRGIKSFVDFSQKMIEDFGDIIRPYLKAFYNGAREMPGMEDLSKEMDSHDAVSAFDVNNFDKRTEEKEEKPQETAETTDRKRLENIEAETQRKRDELFGLTPVEKISSAEEITSNIEKFVSGLVEHEDELKDTGFDGFVAGSDGRFEKNAQKQVEEYVRSLSSVDKEITDEWKRQTGITSTDALNKYVSSLYRNAKSQTAQTESAPKNSAESQKGQTGKQGNNQSSEKQANTASEKIEDVGEKIAGARKDMLRDMAKSMQEVTEESLIALPFAKAFKRPDLNKAVENGALRPRDARFAEALMAAFLSHPKPRVSKSRSSYERARNAKAIENWAKVAKSGADHLEQLFSMDEAQRDEFIEKVLNQKAYNESALESRLADLRKWNPDSNTESWGRCRPLNPLAVFFKVYEQLGYDSYGDVKCPVAQVTETTAFEQYRLKDAGGNGLYLSRPLLTEQDVVDEIVYATKVANGDMDTDHPKSAFRAIGKEPTYDVTGYYFAYSKGLRGKIQRSEEFKTSEEAEKARLDMKDKGYDVGNVLESRARNGYGKYTLSFCTPTGEYIDIPEFTFGSKEELLAALDERHDDVNEAVNSRLAEGKPKGERKSKEKARVLGFWNDERKEFVYGVYLSDKYTPYAAVNNTPNTVFSNMPYTIKDGFATKKEAEAYLNEHRAEIEKITDEIDKARRDFTFFDGTNESRVGEDYRKGKDVSAEEFRSAFGFRGVQFGNWTNQKDRQAAINNAYDSLMDLANLLGISPKALSLNGELGIAFGARGSGKASAHYESAEVVINLTKTKGAGSLAHEWWHALDNYFSRQGNVKSGFVTDNKGIKMRDEMRQAFNRLLDRLEKSDYDSRSRQRGADYWGSKVEETARMFEMWVSSEMAKLGERNNFLVGEDANMEEAWAKMNYSFYQLFAEKSGRTPMTFEEFCKTPYALDGFVYPTQAELETFGSDLRNIFDTVQERVDEETGNVALFQMDGSERDSTSPENRLAFDTVTELLDRAGVETELLSNEEMEQLAESEDARLLVEQRSLIKAVNTIKGWLSGNTRGKSFTLALPKSTQRMIRRVMGKDFDSHNITANGVAHAKKNHGVGGRKLTDKSIPLRDADLELIPYIMVAPDYVERGSTDLTHRESIRFCKKLSNGEVVVVEKEYKNSPNDMETITMWADLSSSAATNASRKTPDTHVRNAILSTEDRAKIVKDAESAIQKDASQKMTVYHGSAAKFDHFDPSFMGTGEGAQAYGWGSYVTEVEGIGKSYAQTALNTALARKSVEDKSLLSRLFSRSPRRELYTVSIPDDVPGTYLRWDSKYGTKTTDAIDSELKKLGYSGINKERNRLYGGEIYQRISNRLGSDKYASILLARMGLVGIKVPTNFTRRGAADGTMNYVIFKESDLKIMDRIDFLRNGDTVYGAAVGGKILLNAERLNPNTPVHEYTHLWDKAVQQKNPELWKRGVELMKQTSVWQEVANDPNYAGLDENGIASEVHSRLAGDKGEVELERMSREVLNGNGGILDKAAKMSVIQKLRKWLSEFWYWVKNTLTPWSAEEAERVSLDDFVNMPIADLAKGTRFSESQLNAEERGIVERAKADGTYMKAPNGKPTNLNEKQWAQVRTKAFKDWFGDWELANLYQRALTAWNNKESKGKVVFGLSASAKARFSELLGKDIKQLVITDDSIRHIKKNHSENEKSRGQKDMTPEDVVIIPYLINNFDSMELNPVYDDKQGNRAVEIRKRINGVSVVATIEKGKDKEFVVTNYQKVKSDALDASSKTPGPNVRNDSDLAKVREEIEKIKIDANNSSKVVDENGEPLVVYHGFVGNDFSVFDKDIAADNSRSAEPVYGAFFFSDNNDNASGYGSQYEKGVRKLNGVKDTFLNLKNPLVVDAENKPYHSVRAYFKELNTGKYNWDKGYLENGEKTGVQEITIAARHLGYDGVIFKNLIDPSGDELIGVPQTTIATFNPNNIKSATDNTGEFSTEDNDIRFQIGTDQSQQEQAEPVRFREKKSSAEETDAAYNEAVEKGDMAAAQRLVDEQAERMMPDSKVRNEDGTLKKVYHGSDTAGFTVFDRQQTDDGRSFFFTDNEKVGAAYAESKSALAGKGEDGSSYTVYLDLKNPFELDAEGSEWSGLVVNNVSWKLTDNVPAGCVDAFNRILAEMNKRGMQVNYANEETDVSYKFDYDSTPNLDEWFSEEEYDELTDELWNAGKSVEDIYDYIVPELNAEGKSTIGTNTRTVCEMAQNAGYDGVIFSNIKDGATRETQDIVANDYVAFDPSAIKSADAVTRNDEGNVIPLSERFNESIEDIRFRRGTDFYDGVKNKDEFWEIVGYSLRGNNGKIDTLVSALESYYGGKIRSASNGAKLAIEENELLPFPDRMRVGLDGEYHHIMFEREDGETFVEAVPFDSVETVESKIDNGELKTEMTLNESLTYRYRENEQKRLKLLNTVPVVVEKEQIVGQKGVKGERALDKALNWFSTEIGKPLVFSTEIGNVVFDEQSVRSSLAHKYGQAKLDALLSIPDGFPKSTYLTTMADMDGKNEENSYFAYPIIYDGQQMFVICRTKKSADSNSKRRIYIHEVFSEDTIKEHTLHSAAGENRQVRGMLLYANLLKEVLGANLENKTDKTREDNILYKNEDRKPFTDSPVTNHSVSLDGMREAGQQMSESLGVEVVFIRDSELPEGHHGAMGMWKGGKVYVCLENHTSADEVKKTIL